MDPSARSLRPLGRDDTMKCLSALSVGTNGRYREDDVIPSGAEGGVEESVGKMGVRATFAAFVPAKTSFAESAQRPFRREQTRDTRWESPLSIV